MTRVWALPAIGLIILAACSAGIRPDTLPDTPAATSETTNVLAQPETTDVFPTILPPATRQELSDSAPPGITAAPEPVVESDGRELISIDISMFLLVDDTENPDLEISSSRTEDDLRRILDGMNEIWSQADIYLDPKSVDTIEVPQDVLRQMARGNIRAFFAELGSRIDVPQPSTLNGFYVKSVGGPNGINPFSSRSFLVIDEPSVHDRRVSSHEVGHILGLHHVLTDSNRLLFSGTNGMALTDEEAAVARYVAQGILDGVR